MFRQLCWLLGVVLFVGLLTPAMVEPGQGGGQPDKGTVKAVYTEPGKDYFVFVHSSGTWNIRPSGGKWNIRLPNRKQPITDLAQLKPQMTVNVYYDQQGTQPQAKGKTRIATKVVVLPK